MSPTPRPDFLRPVRGPHPLSRVACVVALLVLALAGQDAYDAWQTRAAAWARRDAPVPLQAAAVRPVSPAQAEARRALSQAVVSLARPWPAALAAVEASAVPGVAWLSLDIGERGTLRLEGLAPDANTALAAAEALRGQGGWGDVLVARMNRAPDGQQRFALVATAAEAAW